MYKNEFLNKRDAEKKLTICSSVNKHSAALHYETHLCLYHSSYIKIPV